MSLEKLTLDELKKQRPDLVAALEKEIRSKGKKELDDLSGPFNPNLTFEDMSKEFLLKLMGIWQYAWITLSGKWYDEVRSRWGFDAANECELAAWVAMGTKVNPRYARLGNVKLNDEGKPATLLECMKCLQLPLDNIMKGKNAGLFEGEFEIINPNKVHVIYKRCVALEGLERNWPERVPPLCHVLEKKMIEVYALNPRFEAVPLKLPPRKSKDEIACEWIFQLKE
ncbi:MAG: hypothetical protein FJ012_00060 [Chloroflexi bacterium]|nr:hypothetical protein [Chloroflexota bacterium]